MDSRRRFLQTIVAGSAAVTVSKLWPVGIGTVALADTQMDANAVRFSDEIEPTVRLLEETPRDKLLEEVAARIKRGSLSYREVVAALMLAGIRNVQPRPSVGFKFHTVLVVNSAHLASINSPAEDRWLPIFWALDYFKYAQADDQKRGDWTMPAVDDAKLPPFRHARQEFQQAMDDWDPEKADAAIAALARGASENELFELMAHYGSRDFRDIGHKAIFVANAFRTINCIGWHHAEPILRSLAYALQCRGNDPNPATHDLTADQPERRNRILAEDVRDDWQEGQTDYPATNELVNLLHDCDDRQVPAAIVEKLNLGVAPQSIYDGLYVAASEMLMRRPNIVSLHAVTTTNALGYAYRRTSDRDLRLRILLQNSSFLAMFLARLKSGGKLPDKSVEQLAGAESTGSTPDEVSSILTNINADADQAASQVLGLLDRDPTAAGELFDATRRMIFFKGSGSHDYKYSSAVLEDFYHVSPSWRNRYLASSIYKFRGSGERDTQLLPRIRAAF
jgi:hypothetical protein